MAQLLRFAFDAAAGAILGGAVCFALVSVFHLPLLAASSLGAITFLRVFYSLARPPAAVPGFVPAPLEFDPESGELFLDQSVAVGPDSARVVRLQTPGELHRAIEQHLESDSRHVPDAVDELRDALDQLRRAVR